MTKVFNARLNLFLVCNSLIWIGICDHAAGALCIMDFAATIQYIMEQCDVDLCYSFNTEPRFI